MLRVSRNLNQARRQHRSHTFEVAEHSERPRAGDRNVTTPRAQNRRLPKLGVTLIQHLNRYVKPLAHKQLSKVTHEKVTHESAGALRKAAGYLISDIPGNCLNIGRHSHRLVSRIRGLRINAG